MFNPSKTLAKYGQEFGWDQVIEVKDRPLALRLDPISKEYAAVEPDRLLDEARRFTVH